MRIHNERGELRLTPRKIWRRAWRSLVGTALLVRYSILNRISRFPVVEDGSSYVVSLTTHGPRLLQVYAAIESIGRGSVLPARLVLFVDEDDVQRARAHPPLRRLVLRGLEIRPAVASLRAHKKYIHIAESDDWDDLTLIIADDDIFFPRKWLEGIDAVAQSRGSEVCVISQWTKTYRVADDGSLAPYLEWPSTVGARSDRTQFFLGGHGTLLPRQVVAELRKRGRSFQGIVDSADDIWLNWVARQAGATTCQVEAQPQSALSVPSTQRHKLSVENVLGGKNDQQIRRLYTRSDVGEIQIALSELEVAARVAPTADEP